MEPVTAKQISEFGPKFVRAEGGKSAVVLYPNDQEIAGIELWIAQGDHNGAESTFFVVRPTDADQRVFVQVRDRYPIQDGDVFVAGRQRCRFEQTT